MKRSLSIIILMLLTFVSATSNYAQKRKDRKVLFGSTYNYEIETIKVGQDGTKYVKVWGYGKKVDLAITQAKINAVAACVFRGLPGSANANSTPALCSDPNAEETHAEYFQNFFAVGGPYLKFINVTTDGIPSGQDRREVKGGYKVAIYVQVMFDNLRKQLESDNIIRKLNTGF